MTWPSGLAMSDIIGLAVEGPVFTGMEFRSGSLFPVEGLLTAPVFRALRGTAGLRTLPDQNDRPRTVDRFAV